MAAFRDHAEVAAEVFKEHGSLAVIECWGDDVPDGVVTSCPMAVKSRADETVCFSWIMWPSRDIRNEVMSKIMSDSRMNQATTLMPFDGKRMIYGGFEVVVDAWHTSKLCASALVRIDGSRRPILTSFCRASPDWPVGL